MSRKTLVRANKIAVGVGLALALAGLLIPHNYGIALFALGLGLITFCLIIGLVLLLTKKA